MQNILNKVTDERLKAYIIWLPMFPGDNRKQAQKRSDEFTDERVRYFWDEERVTGKTWQPVLEIERLAWDVYFLYDANVHWQGIPTYPTFWMHQLSGVEKGTFLNEQVFQQELTKLLDN